jgi:hypothetical protein
MPKRNPSLRGITHHPARHPFPLPVCARGVSSREAPQFPSTGAKGRRTALARSSVLEYLLIGDLRDFLDESPDRESRRSLLAVLEELLNLLPNEFEYEDQGGYLTEVCDLYPNLSNTVERLHREHDDLYFSLLELRNRIGDEQSFEFIADEVKPKLRRWIEAARRHHESEQQLIVASYDTAFGGED